MSALPLKILFASPAYYPALAFGGPIWMARELNEGMVARGHSVQVVTTSLRDVRAGRSYHSATSDVFGVRVHYLATPARYRWMGITPTLPHVLRRLERPDVAHLFGFRDVVTTTVARWCRRNGIPYLFEPLGMFMPRLRKIRFKQVFDSTVTRHVAAGATMVIATSEHERDQIVASGVARGRVEIRRNGFPDPAEMPPASGALRERLGLGDEPVVLYVGRIAAGKGIEHLLQASRALPDFALVLAGPDDGHGIIDRVRNAGARVHRLEPQSRPLELYADADVFALPSTGESFGMVAAEAAAAGTAVLVTDRCGVAEVLRDGGAVVVPYDGAAVTEALGRLLADADLRRRLGERGREIAREQSWARMVERQEELYRAAVECR